MYPYAADRKMIFVNILQVGGEKGSGNVLNNASNTLTTPYTSSDHTIFFIQALHIMQ
jgi:hypothetical protein